jgi:hypothetical protein
MIAAIAPGGRAGPAVSRAVAVAQVRLNQVADIDSRFRRCPPTLYEAAGLRWHLAWSVAAPGASAQRRPRPGAGSGEEGQDFADGAFPPGGFWPRRVCLDLVAVAAAVFLLDDVAGLGQVATMP